MRCGRTCACVAAVGAVGTVNYVTCVDESVWPFGTWTVTVRGVGVQCDTGVGGTKCAKAPVSAINMHRIAVVGKLYNDLELLLDKLYATAVVVVVCCCCSCQFQVPFLFLPLPPIVLSFVASSLCPGSFFIQVALVCVLATL